MLMRLINGLFWMKKNPAEAGLIDHSVILAIKLQLIEA